MIKKFAQIENGVVINTILAAEDFIYSGIAGDPKIWVEFTDEKPMAVGFTHDKENNIFIPPKPYESWILNKNKAIWEPPIPRPNDKENYHWDEPTKSWITGLSTDISVQNQINLNPNSSNETKIQFPGYSENNLDEISYKHDATLNKELQNLVGDIIAGK